ncbi:hypothetical protein D3C85_895040 [compost metagenome]
MDVYQHFMVIFVGGFLAGSGRGAGQQNRPFVRKVGEGLGQIRLSSHHPARRDRSRQDALCRRGRCRWIRDRNGVRREGADRAVCRLLGSWVLASMDCKPVGDSLTLTPPPCLMAGGKVAYPSGTL